LRAVTLLAEIARAAHARTALSRSLQYTGDRNVTSLIFCPLDYNVGTAEVAHASQCHHFVRCLSPAERRTFVSRRANAGRRLLL
jgi:hypothetical protein